LKEPTNDREDKCIFNSEIFSFNGKLFAHKTVYELFKYLAVYSTDISLLKTLPLEDQALNKTWQKARSKEGIVSIIETKSSVNHASLHDFPPFIFDVHLN
jgi:hypothetical protein